MQFNLTADSNKTVITIMGNTGKRLFSGFISVYVRARGCTCGHMHIQSHACVVDGPRMREWRGLKFTYFPSSSFPCYYHVYALDGSHLLKNAVIVLASDSYRLFSCDCRR